MIEYQKQCCGSYLYFDAVPDPDPACPFDADPEPDPIFPFDPDKDPDPSFQIKAQNLDIHLACHLQIIADLDPDPDPAYHLDEDADSDPDPIFQFNADPCGSGSTTLPMRVSGSLYLNPIWNTINIPPSPHPLLVNGMPCVSLPAYVSL